MPSKKTRVNLTVDDDLNELLTALSKIDGKPKKPRLSLIFLSRCAPTSKN